MVMTRVFCKQIGKDGVSCNKKAKVFFGLIRPTCSELRGNRNCEIAERPKRPNIRPGTQPQQVTCPSCYRSFVPKRKP